MGIREFNSSVEFVSGNIKRHIDKLPSKIKQSVQEIRLRVNCSVAIVCPGKTYFLKADGAYSEVPFSGNLITFKEDIDKSFRALCKDSVYSFENQIKNGFVTFGKGHRVGVCGTAIIDNHKIIAVRDITSLNIRIAKEFDGCSGDISDILMNSCGGLLLAGPPASGKTTVLRDLAKKLSLNANYGFPKISVCDERGELSAVQCGSTGFDVGLSDVFAYFPKNESMLMAIRSASPDIIVCDELGGDEDCEGVVQCLNAGVRVIASVHAKNARELCSKPQILKIMATGAFENAIFLQSAHSPGIISKIYKVSELYDKSRGVSNFDNIRSFRRFRSV